MEATDLFASLPVCFWNRLDFRGRSLEKLRTLFSFFSFDSPSSSLSELQWDVTATSSSDVGVAGVATFEEDLALFSCGLPLDVTPGCWFRYGCCDKSGGCCRKLGGFIKKSGSGYGKVGDACFGRVSVS
jgi:hypothetical protein